jgi:biopolymer transport protein ExbD
MAGLDPPPRRRFAFMLTPLVDVMFLLLMFFMLSSQTAPYTLLTIFAGGQPAAGDTPAQPQQPAAGEPKAKGDVLVSIGNGYVRFNGERIDMADLPATIERYRGEGFSSAVVYSTRAASVQDIVSVLEAFQSSAFGEMRLVTQGTTP